MAREPQTALVIVMSPITRDPRVRRQIDWLTEDGWIVDTVGPAGQHVEEVREHFGLADAPGWVQTPFGSAIIYGLLPHRAKFRVLTRNRIPNEVSKRISRGYYDLVVFNDHHFLPWIADRKTYTSSALAQPIHLDIHEYVTPRVERDSLWRKFAGPYYDWIRTFIGDPRFATRSTVVPGIADLYAAEFNLPPLAIVRNCPPYVEQVPLAVEPGKISLLHHGGASWHRGIYQMIDAMRMADERFTLTLMLVGADEEVRKFKEHAKGLEDRVLFVPPVPMQSLARAVNVYDLEVMFYPPLNRNLEFALPNKLFEAVQGRLGLVIGESPAMADLIGRYGNGIVVTGWTGEDLGRALNALTENEVERMKNASNAAAPELSAEAEKTVFFETVMGSTP